MKILFLSGSLEPGRDGVGDYTRRLAGGCIRQGHEAAIVALNERGDPPSAPASDNPISPHKQDDYGTPVSVWRWSSKLSWRTRGRYLKQIIQTEQPDLVSIQFVPYSFHSKGLPFGFVRMIRRVAKAVQVPWQIMFHELWITRQHSRMGWLIGPIQRQLCLALPKIVPSPIIHTHLTAYLERLSANGLVPQRLPLFGNIPVVPGARVETPPPGLPEDGTVILHFGTISPRIDWLRARLQALRDEFSDNEKDCHFVSIGSAGQHREAARQAASGIFGEDHVHFLGNLSAEQISAWMQRAQVGLSRSPLSIYEKSGSTAAMLEHRLEVRLMDSPAPPDVPGALPKFPPVPLPSVARTAELFLATVYQP